MPESTPSYTVRESARAKYLRITVYPDGHVVVTKPKRTSLAAVAAFVREREAWIHASLTKLEKHIGREALPKERRGTKAYEAAKKQAHAFAVARLKHFNTEYGFTYARISIRDQKSRWGSASRRGNLNFSYRIIYLPEHLSDYIIVHELCHLGALNHSARFWALVARTIPDWKAARRELATRYRL
jgi:predicted metal-dependent hydrolase